MKGSAVASNALRVDVQLKYEKFRLLAGWERASADLSVDTARINVTERKKLSSLFVKPGYGNFYAGFKTSTSPLMQANSTSLLWVDTTTLFALAGFSSEQHHESKAGKPYLHGWELEGSYPLSASGPGSVSFSSVRGYGLSVRGYAEKSISAQAGNRVSLGLDSSLAYEKLKADAAWASTPGSLDRKALEYNLRLYLGVEF